MSWHHPARVAQPAVLGSGLIGTLSAHPRVHAGIALFYLFAMATGGTLSMVQPEPLLP